MGTGCQRDRCLRDVTKEASAGAGDWCYSDCRAKCRATLRDLTMEQFLAKWCNGLPARPCRNDKPRR